MSHGHDRVQGVGCRLILYYRSLEMTDGRSSVTQAHAPYGAGQAVALANGP